MKTNILIKNENNKSMSQTSASLAVFGLFMFFVGKAGANEATAFLGLSFSFLCLLCLILIKNDRIPLAKILWGVVTPLLILVSPYFFTLSQVTSITTYSYLFIGGMLFCAYSFQDKQEKITMWISISLFFIGLMLYDRVIIHKNFEGTYFSEYFSENYIFLKMMQIIHFSTLVFFILVIHKNKIRVENKLSEQIIKLHSFTTNLISTSKNKLLSTGNLIEGLEEVLKSTAHVMDISRMSVWEVSDDGASINLLVSYDILKNKFEYSGSLNSQNYPAYFKHILEEKIISAPDAYNNPKTAEFGQSYLIPNEITSMLDCPFFIEGKFKGILCSEEQRHVRNWDEMDQMFAMAITKLISISYYCQNLKLSNSNLKEATISLIERNKVLKQLNSKMSFLNTDLNMTLTDKVKANEELRKFISEASYKNSHHVRGPLSRILGLISLYKTETDLSKKDKYFAFLEQSAFELDEKIKELNSILGNRLK